MTGTDDEREDAPSLEAIYAFLSTDACDEAIREHFLERWLPKDRTIFDRTEYFQLEGLSADAFIARLAQASRVQLQCHLLRQDPTLDPDADIGRLQDSISGVPFTELTAVGIENLPPLSPPPTPEEIETRIVENKAWNERTRMPEDIAAPMQAMMATLMGKPEPEPEREQPQADPEAAAYAGPFAAAFAPAGAVESQRSPEQDLSEEQGELEGALQEIFADRMEADLTDRFLPQVLVPMVASRDVKQAAGAQANRSPTSGTTSAEGKLLAPLARPTGQEPTRR